MLRIWDGLSVFETLEQARAQALAYPRLGRFVAVLDIPDSPLIRTERTTKTEGHYTIWGPVSVLLDSVVSVVSIDRLH